MSEKNEQDLYQTLSDTQQLLKGLDPTGQRYTLESILAEFSLTEEKAAEGAPAKEEPAAESQQEDVEEPPVEEPAAPAVAAEPAKEEPVPATVDDDFNFEDVVAQTVGAVLDGEPKDEKKREKIALFSRVPHLKKESAPKAEEFDEEAEAAARWVEADEPAAEDSFRAMRREYGELRKRFRLSMLIVVLGAALTLLGGWMEDLIPASAAAAVQTVLLLANCVCALDVMKKALAAVKELCFTAEVLTVLTALAALVDGCLAAFTDAERVGEPLCVVASLAVTMALLAMKLETRAKSESFRLLAVGDPGSVVCESPDGILRQKGSAAGFTAGVREGSAAERWQAVLLPVIFTAAVVFSVLATVGQGKGERFVWCLSLLLAAANSLILPLCFALPYSRIAHRLCHSGAAVAGYAGAHLISRRRRMILTDRDLFPEGSVHLNGIKIYGEEIGKVVAYAASMVRRSDSGLAHIFDDMLAGEGAQLQRVDEFIHSEYGGYSGIIKGETVMLGTDKFMRRNNVALPGALKLKNALFLAVDGQLIAAFAVKYPQVSSTEWAIHTLKRMGISPVLASRDPNLTPALLKQRFGTDAKAVYPSLAERLSLSDSQSRRSGLMGAVLYREGLMPYAEAAVASRRLCRVTHQLTVLALGGSVVSLLLCFYLAFAGAATVLAPLTLMVYQLLWLLSALLLGIGTDRY